MAETERKLLSPYMPYKTFGAFLDHLKAIGTPSHVDKSVMTHLSGGMQSWLKAGLRTMKLIDAKDEPTDALKRLANAAGDARKPLLAPLFQTTYGDLLNANGIDLKNTTPAKVRTMFVETGAQGETVEKQMAFMIAMAKDAGIEMSKLLTTRASARRRPKTNSPKVKEAIHDAPDAEESSNLSAMKTIDLPNSGGTITLSGNINLFNLRGDERKLVFDLIDKMSEFEVKTGGEAE